MSDKVNAETPTLNDAKSSIISSVETEDGGKKRD